MLTISSAVFLLLGKIRTYVKFFRPVNFWKKSFRNWRKLILYTHTESDVSWNDVDDFVTMILSKIFIETIFGIQWNTPAIHFYYFAYFSDVKNMFGLNEVYVFLTQLWVLCVLFLRSNKIWIYIVFFVTERIRNSLFAEDSLCFAYWI